MFALHTKLQIKGHRMLMFIDAKNTAPSISTSKEPVHIRQIYRAYETHFRFLSSRCTWSCQMAISLEINKKKERMMIVSSDKFMLITKLQIFSVCGIIRMFHSFAEHNVTRDQNINNERTFVVILMYAALPTSAICRI